MEDCNPVFLKRPNWPNSVPVESCVDDCRVAKLVYRAEDGAIYKTDCGRTFILDQHGLREELY